MLVAAPWKNNAGKLRKEANPSKIWVKSAISIRKTIPKESDRTSRTTGYDRSIGIGFAENGIDTILLDDAHKNLGVAAGDVDDILFEEERANGSRVGFVWAEKAEDNQVRLCI